MGADPLLERVSAPRLDRSLTIKQLHGRGRWERGQDGDAASRAFERRFTNLFLVLPLASRAVPPSIRRETTTTTIRSSI